jgi:hypothetical protein
MELDWSVDREGDASLVGVRVRNDGAVPRRVRIESRLDGPVLPPRRGGVPESGWDEEGVTAVIDPGDREAFGFAALADPVDPPVEISSVEPADGDEDDGRAAPESESDLARAAVRDLESHRPPREAVAGTEAVDRDGDEAGGGNAVGVDEDSDTEASGPNGDATGRSENEASAEPDADEVDAWFAAVEARIERAERLADADLATATAVVEEAGGLDAVGGLDERVDSDAERLKAIRDRAAALAERAEESEVPTEALEALA